MTEPPATAPTNPTPSRRRRVTWFVLLALLAIELLGIGYLLYQDWSLPSLRREVNLDGHEKAVWAIAFSPDGQHLGVAMEGGGGKVWDVATGKERGTIGGWKDLVALGEGSIHFDGGTHLQDGCAALSSDGRFLARALYRADSISLEDAKTGKSLGALDGHGWLGVAALAFSPDARTLASSGHDGSLRLWDVGTRKERGRLVGHRGFAQRLAFLPDGKSLISGSWDRTVRLWNVSTRQNRATITLKDRVDWLAVSPDGQRFAVQNWKSGELRDCETGTIVATFPPIEFASGALFSPDGRRLAVIRNWPAKESYSVSVWTVPP